MTLQGLAGFPDLQQMGMEQKHLGKRVVFVDLL